MLALAAGCTQATPERRTDGPLLIDQTPYTAYFAVEPGEVFSEGWMMLHTSQPVTIERVQVTGALDPITFLGARLGLPGRRNDFHQRMTDFPPRELPARYQAEAIGARLEPGEGYMLILGFSVDEAQVSVRDRVRIDYTVDGTRYATEAIAELVTCPPPLTEHTCHEQHPPTWPP